MRQILSILILFRYQALLLLMFLILIFLFSGMSLFLLVFPPIDGAFETLLFLILIVLIMTLLRSRGLI